MEVLLAVGGCINMAQRDSRRLAMVLPHLYPDLNGRPTVNGQWKPELADYYLQNDSDGAGTYVIWQNTDIPEPTEQELADGKEGAINEVWWQNLRIERDGLLKASDWSQGADVPEALKSSYVTYRNDLRDLPTTATKPDFETLNNQSGNEWIINIRALMPTKPNE